MRTHSRARQNHSSADTEVVLGLTVHVSLGSVCTHKDTRRCWCSENVFSQYPCPSLKYAFLGTGESTGVNKCTDLACQGWHRLWPSLTRDGNSHLLQAAHQNTLLPGTSIGSNQLVSGHHAIPADGQKGWGAAKAAHPGGAGSGGGEGLICH